MIVGLIFLFQMVQPYFQYFLIKFTLHICCRKHKSLECLIVQNLKSHRRRNNMTALMFTFCICFLMYSGTTFQLLENLVTGLVGQTVAADLMASVPTDSLGLTQTNSYLNERRIAEFLSR
jgi:hypothetical protein